jgi:hypothetical protein
MLARKLIPQVSLRSLFLVTAVAAFLTQAALDVRRHQLEARREAFVINFQEQLVTSRHMRSQIYSERYLAYVERTIQAEPAEFLPREEKGRLLYLLSAERNKSADYLATNSRN